MAQLPRDRFDDIPDDLLRVGAHRAPPRRGRGWIRFAWAALATGVLIVGGLFALSRINPAIQFEIPELGGGGEPTAQPTEGGEPGVEPITDPGLVDPALSPVAISVLNASPNDGVQDAAVVQIAAAGWDQPSAANATSRDEETTRIYYHSAEYEGIALGMRELLGTGELVLSDAFLGAPITIVLGADYAPPVEG